MRACCLAFLFLLAIAGNLCAQFDDPFGGGQAGGAAKPATTAKLLLSHSEAKPGTTV